LTSAEQTGDRIHQDVKGRLAQLTASVAQRQHPLHPAVAFVARAAMGALAPQYAKAQRPLCSIASLKRRSFNQHLVNRILGHLVTESRLEKFSSVYEELCNYGTIDDMAA
jgi:hypothetical protein